MMTGLFDTRQDLSLRKLGSRMVRATRFNGENFRELRDDKSATVQSILLVLITGFCYGAGVGFFGFLVDGLSLDETLTVMMLSVVATIVIALGWSAVTFLMVTRLFKQPIAYAGLLRPFFFALAPGVLFILVANPVPLVSEIIRVGVAAWIGIASVFAVKNAVGFSIQQSMLTFIACVLVLLLALSIISSI